MFWLAALAGGFVSEAAATCLVTTGSSGGVFGLLGVFVADAALSFSTVRWPVFRLLALLVFAALWLASSSDGGGGVRVSHASHLAGLSLGVATGALFLPSLPHELLEMAAPVFGAHHLPLRACVMCGTRLVCLVKSRRRMQRWRSRCACSSCRSAWACSRRTGAARAWEI